MAEISLLDTRGHSVAYIADDGEASIYLWNGVAVAYLVQEKVYGWNGQHIGWFDSGVVRDLRGAQVGFTREACPVPPKVEKVKRVKRVKRVKSVRRASRIRSSNKMSRSTVPLEVFLQTGAK